jgi:hypothetical protein
MKVAHDIRVFDVVGVFIPVVLELNLLVPTLFSLYYVARALGFDADLELRAVVGRVMILSYFVSVIMNSWDYRGAEL